VRKREQQKTEDGEAKRRTAMRRKTGEGEGELSSKEEGRKSVRGRKE
jgi:hypothetical protein